MFSFVKKIFGTQNSRNLKRYQETVARINALEADLQSLSDSDFPRKTLELREKLSGGATLNDILPEAFALCREAAKRSVGMRHFDVQLVGGMVLHEGRIAEMKTGEGKTLVSTLPAYLNALEGKGVHIITVNDYLARRDAAWMGKIHHFLGLKVGVITHSQRSADKKAAYACDITYGTNSEFGFDYLRDNMKFSLESMAQRETHFAIVDEVDSILIDEARTPLIISGPSDPSTDKYEKINKIIPGLIRDTHYQLDEKSRTASLTEDGVTEVEKRLNLPNLYDPRNMEILHHVQQALRAHTLYKNDVDYVVKNGEVMIVDEFTGRILPGRRWSDGLHQAIEAKEGVKIESENQTLATITYQNFFRMYKKLSGMTGTADTEAAEFSKIYNLQIVVIPPNRINSRSDLNDVIYKTEDAKFKAIAEEIKEEQKNGRPVLVGTVAVEKSERLSAMLTRIGVKHNVLNAKHHEREAEIIAQAGRLNAITVSTNMAGRGTDILLGGNPEALARNKVDPEQAPADYEKTLLEMKALCEAEHKQVVAVGGLYVIGTERHESRRIDNQLRGRAGRQGDPGQTRFYISLQDDLMRIFGSERIASVMERMGMKEDEVIEHKWITRAIEGAQKRVEERNFEIRKNVLEYDDVMNQQRTTIYSTRRKILANADLDDAFTDMIDQVVDSLTNLYGPIKGMPFNEATLLENVFDQFGFRLDLTGIDKTSSEAVGLKLYNAAIDAFAQKKARYTDAVVHQAVRYFLLQTLDELWKDHLLSMDHLRDGIGLRGYGQKDPKLEYKKEGYALYQQVMFRYAQSTVERVFKVEIRTEEEVRLEEQAQSAPPVIENISAEKTTGFADSPRGKSAAANPQTGFTAERNDPCPCGSGKKFKKCHGA
jgi:preprotein translocase subunit SecA